MSSAVTEAEVNLSDAVRSVRYMEQQLAALGNEHGAARHRLDAAEVQYAQAVTALVEARKAIR